MYLAGKNTEQIGEVPGKSARSIPLTLETATMRDFYTYWQTVGVCF